MGLRRPLYPGAAGARPRPSEAYRLAAAAPTGAAAAIHASVIGSHLEESWLFAGAFAVMALVQGAWMVGILVAPSRLRYLAGAAVNGAVALTWLVSRTVGLPLGPHPGVAEPVGAMDAVATVAELLAVFTSLVLAWRMELPGTPPPTPAAPIQVGFALLVSGFVASVVPNAAPGTHDFGSQPWSGPGLVGHLVILAGMLTTLAGVLAVAVRGGTRPSRERRRS